MRSADARPGTEKMGVVCWADGVRMAKFFQSAEVRGGAE